MKDQIVSSGGWCAPTDFMVPGPILTPPEDYLDLPSFTVIRGGIDFNAPPRPPVYVATHCEHRWERASRAMQCGCAQCHVDDPRGLDCSDCPARMDPGDPEFDTLYEAAPWWWDAP